MAFAHSKNDQGERHDLVAHLRAVGNLTARFADALGAREAGYWLGLWHDLGKFDPKWQDYLLQCEADPNGYHGRVDHKAAGTILACNRLGTLGLLIQGHHGGLRQASGLAGWVDEMGGKPGAAQALAIARQTIPDLEPGGPIELPAHARGDRLRAELFLRLLFSALIDADRLDTERHTNAWQMPLRGSEVTLAELWERFARNQEQLIAQGGQPAGKAAQVWHARQEIYNACLTAAEQPPDLFRLEVPTGGGKTRSAMAFALRHALRYGHERIIVAVPFISITQQTAQVYRDIFGQGDDERPVVLEHHSGVQLDEGDGDDFRPPEVWARLAAENWDAPIIVTTTVQLFESLFAASTSQTRKLHRLAHSVVILDEAQALPPHLLDPILDALRDLCSSYGTTVVLSTATQPAFETIPAFASASPRQIVPNPARHFESLTRVTYDWRTERPLAWTEVAELMRGEPQALAVLNTKGDALALWHALGDPEALHLSTLLCGAHRRATIAEVNRRLAAGEPCRLISTQVVEAGVDLDFPLVLRALGPLDSVIQAAGRCNREGKLEQGHVIAFEPAEGRKPPAGAYSIGRDITRTLLAAGSLDPDDPNDARAYFQRWYGALGDHGVDRDGIQELRKRLDYPEVARKFRMIDDDTESVIITKYGDPEERHRVDRLIDRLRAKGGDIRRIMRQLQPYVVSVRRREAERYRRQGLIDEPLLPGVSLWLGDYHRVLGLTGADLDPEALVV